MYSPSHSSVEPLEARIAPAFAPIFDLSSLNGLNGFKLSGVAAGDQSGGYVSDAGDVNGDGLADLIIGAAFANSNGLSHSGASYVVFGRDDGFAPNLNLSSLDGTNGFKISGDAADDTAARVSAAGDINGDGFGDLIIGATFADPNGTSEAGASYVVFGKAGGFAPNLNLASLDGGNGFKLSGVAAADYSGISVSAAGDVNGDNFDDLIIGAAFADPAGSNSGASYVVFGKASGFTPNLNLASLDGGNGFKLSGVAAGDYSGISVSTAGDVNGDGFADVIIGARGADPNGSGSGASYVVFGKASGFAGNLNLSALNGTNGFKLSGVAANDKSGNAVSGAGDVNGDGFDDLIIGAPQASPGSGVSYVVFGKANGFAANFNLSALNGSNGFKLSGAGAGKSFGASVSGAGDVNGDGFADLIVGAFGSDPNGAGNYVVFGKTGGFVANLDVSTLNGSNGFAISGGSSSVSAAGDVNGDHFDDLIIGGTAAGPSNSGESSVVFGRGPELSISDASVVEGDGGMTALQFTVSLSEAGINPVLVGVATSDGTALAANDYTATQTQLTFAPGELSKTVTVNVTGETLFEGDETFSVGIVSENAVIRKGTGIGTILNDDGPPLVEIASGSIFEGDSATGSLTFAVSLSAPSGLPVSVTYATTDGTALAGSDYAALAPGMLTFAPGETTKTIAVDVLGDAAIEDHETFVVALSNASGATIGAGVATATILNDDTALRITGPAETLESDLGAVPFVFTVTLEKESVLPVTVSYSAADGTAIFGSDFIAPEAGMQITFAPGETTKTISVDVLGDVEVEAHESFSVILSDAVHASIASGAATGTILNDDTLIQISDESLLEGHAASHTMVFTITLAAPSALPVSVDFASADGTAMAGVDYTALEPGKLEFAPGETSKTIALDVLGDTAVEASETLSVLLANAVNAMIDDNTGLGTILNDDVTLLSAHKATFTDVDGERVTIKISKGALKVEDFTIFPAGLGAQLALVDLRGETEFSGANLKINAKTAPRGVAGDGMADTGFIDATGIDLGKVAIKGDLAQIDVGDGEATKPALKALAVRSLGARALTTQLPGADANLQSDFDGDMHTLQVKGSVSSGVTLATGGRLGSGAIGGNFEGATLSALGLIDVAKARNALAIGALTIGGDVADSRILAGYDRAGVAANADQSIGRVFVGGTWRASDLVAGIAVGSDTFFGTADDAPIQGGNALLASIASVVVKGAVEGTENVADSFGFVAEEIGVFKAAGSKLPLTPGPGNDTLPMGPTGNLHVLEIA